MEGPRQIAVVGNQGGQILEQGDHTPITADDAQALYVEIECDNCGEVGTYGGELVAESNHRYHSNHREECHHCSQPLEATVQLKEDTTRGGLDIEGFDQPSGGSYIHDPYFANKIDEVDEDAAR